MGDLIITENITLDGVIDAAGDWFAPAGNAATDQSDLEVVLRDHMSAADAFLVGRVTFEDMRGFWPKQSSDTPGVREYLNSVQKYVVSGALREPGWENTTVLRGPLREEILKVKSTARKDVVTAGSAGRWESGAAGGPDGALGAHRQVVAAQDAVGTVGVEELIERGEVLGGEYFGDGAADALQAAEGVAADGFVAGALDVHSDGVLALDGESRLGEHRAPVGATVRHMVGLHAVGRGVDAFFQARPVLGGAFG